MINDIKLGFKLMTHGLQFKTSILGSLMFIVLGIALEGSSEFNTLIGSIYMLMGAIMIYQLVHSVTCAGLVQTSPQKKKLQTSIPAVCTFLYALLLNTIMILMKLVLANHNHAPMSAVATSILIVSLSTVILLVFMGAAMKAFWVATTLFMIAFGFVGFLTTFMENRDMFKNLNISLGTAITISYLAIIVGSILMYLISLALYKKEYSKITFESSLKRAK